MVYLSLMTSQNIILFLRLAMTGLGGIVLASWGGGAGRDSRFNTRSQQPEMAGDGCMQVTKERR